jgi:hypothetical protein
VESDESGTSRTLALELREALGVDAIADAGVRWPTRGRVAKRPWTEAA